MNATVKNILKKHLPILKEQYHIRKIGIFGSYARDEEMPESDIDILVEYSSCPTLFELIDTEIYLEEIYQKKIDLVEKGSIRPELKKMILNEVVFV